MVPLFSCGRNRGSQRRRRWSQRQLGPPLPGDCRRRPLGRFEPLEPRAMLDGAGWPFDAPFVDMGPSDNVAWDQPRVTVGLFEQLEPPSPVGPSIFSTFLLDTGANSILAMASAVADMPDYQTEGTFVEFGVAGEEHFDISAPYYFVYQAYSLDPQQQEHVLPGPVLFVDNYDRPDNSDVDAVSTGMGGSLAPLVWMEPRDVPGGNDARSVISGNQLQVGVGSGTSHVFLDHNFVDQAILDAGEFSVQFEVAEINGGADPNNRVLGFGVGFSQAEGNTDFDRNLLRKADFFLALSDAGNIRVYQSADPTGTDESYVPPSVFDVAVGATSGTLRADFAVSDFHAGSTVDYQVFFNDMLQAEGSFTWSGTDENYIGIDGSAANFTTGDNLVVAVRRNPARILSNSEHDVSMFGPYGVAGMPLMANRVTTFDMTGWTDLATMEDWFMKVQFADDLPAPPAEGDRYSIALDNRQRWDPEGQVTSGPAPPVWADVPFLTAIPAHNGRAVAGNFLYDTGAQMSVIGTDLAIAIGLDSNGDGQLDAQDANYAGEQTVGGVGGQITAPMFVFDEIYVPTREGPNLLWTDLQWLVLDIADGIDGVLGAEFLTGGWVEAFFVTGKSGYIEKAHLDFRGWQRTGDEPLEAVLYVDLNPEIDSVIDPSGPGAIITQTGGSTLVTEGGAADTYQIALSTPPAEDVIITLSNPEGQLILNGVVAPGEASLRFTPDDWNTPQIVQVEAVDDDLSESFHRSSILHEATSGDPSYNGVGIRRVIAAIVDNDTAGVSVVTTDGTTEVSEDGQTDTYELVLTSAPSADVTIEIQSFFGQVEVQGAPIAELVFTPDDWHTPQTVTVGAVDDLLPEGPHSDLIQHTSSSADPDYNSGDIFGVIIPYVTVEITDNDVAEVILTPTGTDTQVVEGGAWDTYEVALSRQPADWVRISLVNDDNQLEAVDAADGTSHELVFTPADWSPKTVRVMAVDDGDFEGPHSGLVKHVVTSADLAYDGISPTGVAVEIFDNDSNGPGVLLLPTGGSMQVVEGGYTDTYQVVLTSAPSQDVTVALLPDGQLTASHNADPAAHSLQFTAANWNLPQLVRVTAVDDDAFEGDHTGSIEHGFSSSNDAVYAALAPVPFSVSVIDNDLAPAFDLDVDGDGNADALTDGVVMLRYLFGFTGQPMVNGALSAVASRTDPDEIAAILDAGRTDMLDVDANGHADALTDGILIMRYLFGFRGDALTDGALDPNAERTSPGQIAAFLDSYNPETTGGPSGSGGMSPTSPSGGLTALALVEPPADSKPGAFSIAQAHDAALAPTADSLPVAPGVQLDPQQLDRLARALAYDALQTRPERGEAEPGDSAASLAQALIYGQYE